MMLRFREGMKRNLSWLPIGLSVILAAGNLWFLGTHLQRQRSLDNLQAESLALEGDLSQLQAAEAQGLQSLQASLKTSQDRLAALKSAFPEIGAGFDLFRRSFELASASGVEILSIRRTADLSQSSPAGTIHEVTYSVAATGGLGQCMQLLRLLEDEGLQTVALDNINIDPTAEECDFDVRIASMTPTEAQDSAAGEVVTGGSP